MTKNKLVKNELREQRKLNSELNRARELLRTLRKETELTKNQRRARNASAARPRVRIVDRGYPQPTTIPRARVIPVDDRSAYQQQLAANSQLLTVSHPQVPLPVVKYLRCAANPAASPPVPIPYGGGCVSGIQTFTSIASGTITTGTGGFGFFSGRPSYGADDTNNNAASTAAYAGIIVDSDGGAGIVTQALVGSAYNSSAFQAASTAGTGGFALRGRCIAYTLEVTNTTAAINAGGFGYIGQMPPNSDSTGLGTAGPILNNLLIQKTLLPVNPRMGVKNTWHWINDGDDDMEFRFGFAPASVEPWAQPAPPPSITVNAPVFFVFQAPTGLPQTFKYQVYCHFEVMGNPTGGPALQSRTKRPHHSDLALAVHKALERAQSSMTDAAHSATENGHQSWIHKVGHFFSHEVSDIVHDPVKAIGGALTGLLTGRAFAKRPQLTDDAYNDGAPPPSSSVTIEEMAEEGATDGALLLL